MNLAQYPHPFLDFHPGLKKYIDWPVGKAPPTALIFRDNIEYPAVRILRIQL